MSLDIWKEFIKVPVRDPKLSIRCYILYIPVELTELLLMTENEKLATYQLQRYENSWFQPEQVTLSDQQISALNNTPNTLLLNNIDDLKYML